MLVSTHSELATVGDKGRMFSHVTLKRRQTLLRAVVTTAHHRIPTLSQGPEQGLITTNLANDSYNSFHHPQSISLHIASLLFIPALSSPDYGKDLHAEGQLTVLKKTSGRCVLTMASH